MVSAPTEFILDLALLSVAAFAGGMITKKAGYPAALGEMVIGIAIGPFALGFVRFSEFLELFAELGAIILLFYIGLETELDVFTRHIKPSSVVAIAGAVLPFVLGYYGALAMGFEGGESLLMGTVLMATSLGITIRMLKDIDRLHTHEGTIILGAGVIDDIIAVVSLTIITSLLAGAFALFDVGLLGGKIAFFWIIALVIGMRIVAPLFDRFVKNAEVLILLLLALAFGFAFISAQLGLSAIIGAFAAGMAISKMKLARESSRSLDSIFAFFVPIFFVSVGMQVDLRSFAIAIVPGLALTALAVLGKVAGCGLAAKFMGSSNNESLRIGVGMIPRGEMGLIVATIGLASGFLRDEAFSASIVVVVLTTVIALPALRKLFHE
ncbi:MAG: cation:proton antiporter [Candidatus Bathyarchaeia archaeon]